jgi:hypothetical protein
MWSDTPEGRELIMEVSKCVVAEVDPEELPLFDELMESYLADPHSSGTDSDDQLGFGLGEFVSMVTPAAGAAVSAVLTYILNEVIKTTQEEGAKAITKRIKDWLSSETGTKALTADQLKRIQEIVMQQAALFDMDPSKAMLMASALVGSLALSS